MRVLALLGATVVAFVTAAVATPDGAQVSFNPNSFVAVNDRATESGVIAQDFEEEQTSTAFRYDPTQGNEMLSSVWLANNVLGAYDDYEDEEVDPTPQCSDGPIDVLFLVSSCFTGAEIKSILNPIDCAMTDGTMTFYHNGQPIAIRPTFGIYYYDCHTPRVVGSFKNLEQVYAPTHKDVFVAVSKGKENSFLKIFSFTGIKVAYSLQPTPIESCQTAGKVLVDYSSNNLDATIKAEAAFKSFYDDANVLDNGDVDEATGANVRDDDQTAQVQDFFATEFSDVDFETSCFASSFATDLIAKMTNTFDPNDLLECKRCCHKTTTLGGTYYDYSCDASPAELKHFEGRDEDSCSFDRCITMTGSALVDTTTTITDTANVKSQKIVDGLPDSVQLDGSTIHRSIPCTTHDATNPACAFRAQIDTLFKPSASWNKDLGVPDNYAVDDYVRWNYYVGIGGVQEWNPQDVLEFTDSSTDVVVRAYTQCGLVAEFEFQVVLYPHNSHDACASFDAKWVLAALSSNQVTPISPSDKPASCAYPGSDFAVATFTYDIDDIMTHSTSHVQGTYTDVKCYATVASAGHLDDVSEVELPLGSWTPGTKINLAEQLALELVHEPSTALDTDVRLRCDFTFQHYDETTTVTEPCKHEITITECSEPEIEQRGDEVCTDGKCLDPVGAPGPYEACGGVVVTTTSESDETKTAIKAVDDTCCAACSTTLYCNALPEASGVKRCELKASGFTIVALASSIQNGDFNAGAMAAVGVSAMVAIIAVVIVKRRAAANRLKIDDDVYYPLLE
ncbi:Amino Acid/Auxin Permease (AAAP) Family [Phytophthora cinnamomi]|uniref:Amino Acid/Auxin Permease (AAAP) Family n=1 Tax=Phytophthora cinnamomi TaxID=4785 RepID=UPI00355A276C|nr:Amino Acid/Auxin Permease (AAAP) Family [Phytophthora cinnamomi]